MLNRFRKLWPYLKLLLAAVIVVVVGRRMYVDLRDYPQVWAARPGWLILSAVLYQVGIGFSGLFWYRLLHSLGQRPGLLASLRAYYISQLGKYVPGKAYAVVWRVDLIRSPGVRAGVAVQSTFYEVLVTMASGSLLAAILFFALWPETGAGFDPVRLWGLLMQEASESNGIGKGLAVALALLLFLPPFLVTLPPIFNRVVGRISLPFRKNGEAPPHILFRTKLEGLLITSLGWFCMGVSVWALLKGLLPESQLPPATPELLLRIIAVNAVVYVAGFEILISPGGLGVREILLPLFFVTILAVGTVGAELNAALNVASGVLRLVWTAAEVLMALAVWRLPGLVPKRADDGAGGEEGFRTSETTEKANSAPTSTNGSTSIRVTDREGKS
jgi:hypothetical protein